VIGGSAGRLRAGALLAVEHGADQGDAVRRLFAAAGFDAIRTHRDGAGLERVTLGVGIAAPGPTPSP
jgi:release factor glutamine methyltransferase